jgi:hypothetical protein
MRRTTITASRMRYHIIAPNVYCLRQREALGRGMQQGKRRGDPRIPFLWWTGAKGTYLDYGTTRKLIQYCQLGRLLIQMQCSGGCKRWHES